MALQGYTLDQQTIQRTAAAVQDYWRRRGIGMPAQVPNGVAPTKTFWVKLDDEDPDNAGRYNWTLQQLVSGEFQDDDHDPVIKDDTDYSAHHANLLSGLSDEYVELEFYGYVSSDSGDGGEDESGGSDPTPLYLFNVGGGGGCGCQYQHQISGYMVSQNQCACSFLLASPMQDDGSEAT
jgi:hypothetical protein